MRLGALLDLLNHFFLNFLLFLFRFFFFFLLFRLVRIVLFYVIGLWFVLGLFDFVYWLDHHHDLNFWFLWLGCRLFLFKDQHLRYLFLDHL